jgi:hypothetical protein
VNDKDGLKVKGKTVNVLLNRKPRSEYELIHKKSYIAIK